MGPIKMWELGVSVINEMYSVSRSAVLLDGECSEAFDVQLRDDFIGVIIQRKTP